MPASAPLGEPGAPADDDARPLGEECRARWARQELDELGTMEACDVAAELCLGRAPDGPSRMLDPILERGAVALADVAPVVIGDERLLGLGMRQARVPGHPDAERVLASGKAPGVADVRLLSGADLVAMGHGESLVVLVEEPARDPGDRAARNQLLDEDDAAPGAFRVLAPHVEPEVHLLEVAVERNGNAEDTRVQEPEAHHAHEGLPVPGIELGAGRDALR